jgi:alpha-L-fucosidase 2
MKYKLALLGMILTGFSACQKQVQSPELWYNKPAADWNEALPVGNGRLGAMVFGDPENERIQINEESIWAGSKINNNNPRALENLTSLQEAIFKGDIRKAEEIANSCFLGTPPRILSYQPLGDLMIKYDWKGQVSEYRRSLDLRSGRSCYFIQSKRESFHPPYLHRRLIMCLSSVLRPGKAKLTALLSWDVRKMQI